METMEDSKMEKSKDKELMCTNKFCYVHKVLQIIPEEMDDISRNCGFDLKPWKSAKK